jgi:hypothetical protein
LVGLPDNVRGFVNDELAGIRSVGRMLRWREGHEKRYITIALCLVDGGGSAFVARVVDEVAANGEADAFALGLIVFDGNDDTEIGWPAIGR